MNGRIGVDLEGRRNAFPAVFKNSAAYFRVARQVNLRALADRKVLNLSGQRHNGTRCYKHILRAAVQLHITGVSHSYLF